MNRIPTLLRHAEQARTPPAPLLPLARATLPLALFFAAYAPAVTATAPARGEARAATAEHQDSEIAQFPLCSGSGRITCVVDGDTIWYRGEKIRLVGFDTPEVSNPGCAREAQLGRVATVRLQELINEGAFSLEPNPEGRNSDRYGRSLRVISRSGRNLGEVLLEEGLAERRGGRRNIWC